MTRPATLRRLRPSLAARLAAAALALLATAPPAAADCAGRDLLAPLAEADPAAHAAILAEGRAMANGGARLWRVTAPEAAGQAGGEGGAPASHLFGTYHDTAAHETLTPVVERAFAEARRLVVELDPEGLAALRARVAGDPGFSLRDRPPPPGAALADRLAAEDRADAEAALAARGLTLEAAGRLAPWLLFSTLGVPACELAAMSRGAPVLDTRLMRRAEARDLPVEGLEDYESALGAIDALPPDIAAGMIVDALRLARHEEDLRATLMALYGAGRIGTLAAAAEMLGQRLTGRPAAEAARLAEAFDARILVARNRAWLDGLLPALEAGGAFVAIGALHLPGEAGLVALLRAEGFTVEPVDEAAPAR